MSVNEIIELSGRRKITTSLDSGASLEEIIADLSITLPLHYNNATEIQYLQSYWLGKQTILDRVKEVREDIDNKVIVNLAQSSTRQILGYTFGKPIEFIHKLENDEDEITVLNNCMYVSSKKYVDNLVFTDMSVCGVGYRMVIPTKGYKSGDYDELGLSPFSLAHLEPDCTFVVYSNKGAKEKVYAVTYSMQQVMVDGKVVDRYVFYIYIGNREYRLESDGLPSELTIDMVDTNDNGEFIFKTNLAGIPIIEYQNNSSLTGDWELGISLIDAINVTASDSVNDIVQFVQSILVFINAEIDKDKADQLKSSKMMSLIAPEGLSADVKYIAQQLDSQRVQFTLEWLEEKFDTVVGIPDRKTRGGGGGDTGEAVKLRDGWGDLEILARLKEPFVEKAELETLKFAIFTLLTYNLIEDLKLYDIEIKFSRNKSDNLLIKTQSYQTLMATQTVTPEDGLTIVDLINDAKDIAAKGEAYWSEKNKETNNIQVQDTSENLNGATISGL